MQSRWERSAAYLASAARNCGCWPLHHAHGHAGPATGLDQRDRDRRLPDLVGAIVHGRADRLLDADRAGTGPMGQVAGLMTQYHNAITAMRALDEIVDRPVERPKGAHFLSRQSFAATSNSAT